ncbi:MAG: UbiX family flavin prenyltransferase [Phycisphaerae bacterium]|nr:UbiX family flavin prenyltransferase [Phycisphaerae bacterium]NUQ47924.1 UbiX family flavin prenyltransferase [Phycisphaerae bacterium]
MTRRFVVAITGASGAAYARRLAQCLAAAGEELHLIVSPYGRRLIADELDIQNVTVESLLGRPADNVTLHGYQDLASPLASGSFLTDGMAVCPCSSNTLGAIASGLGDNLITRAAHVHLKEGRRLILVPREMPLSLIELRNMLALSEAGAVICPAAPGFYLRPRSVDDLIDFVVGKVLDLLNVEHDLKIRWIP